LKIYQNGLLVNLSNKVLDYVDKLKKEQVVTVCSIDHTEHIAAYVAWMTVGGNIFIKAPFLSKTESSYLDEKVLNLPYDNSLFFHTSGTTGLPKIAVHQQQQIQQAIISSTAIMEWNGDVKFLNLLPAFTVGFWNMIIPSLIEHNFSMVLGSRETVLDDLNQNTNVTIIVPGLMDYLRLRNVTIDFSKYNKVGIGSSAVLDRHVEFFFKNKGIALNHMYGTTEVGTPVLNRLSTSADGFVRYLNLTPRSTAEFKILNKELWIKGPSLCANIQDFGVTDGWFNTQDLWDQQDNMIKFIGRSNDIVKLNGFKASLLAIETIAEDDAGLGEAVAVVRNSLGTDWIELFFTNKNAVTNKSVMNEIFLKKLPDFSIPRKFTYIDAVPRNAMGKKIRVVNL
jgi:acyl-coenzyme A synthetase/AMP-(fatty) acid ligase